MDRPIPSQQKTDAQKLLEKLVANSQKVLTDAGMDLNGDGKVAMEEFSAVLQVHNKTPAEALLADVDGSRDLNSKEITALQGMLMLRVEAENNLRGNGVGNQTFEGESLSAASGRSNVPTRD